MIHYYLEIKSFILGFHICIIIKTVIWVRNLILQLLKMIINMVIILIRIFMIHTIHIQFKIYKNVKDKIFSSLLELFYHITNVIKLGDNIRCYNDTNKCFEVFGADIMITDDYQVKLLEINNGAGFTNITDILLGVMETVL